MPRDAYTSMVKYTAIIACLIGAHISSTLSAKPVPDLEILFMDVKMWDQPVGEVLNKRQHLGFRWLSKAKNDARSTQKGLKLWNLPVGETILRSRDGKLHSFEISIYNRGDMSQISYETFNALSEKWKTLLENKTQQEGEKINRTQKGSVVSADRWLWECPGAYIALTKSSTGRGSNKQPEFLKLTLVSVKFGKEMFASRGGITKLMTRRSDLKESVKSNTNGDTFIKNIPMVDQGRKGYCAVASAERVFRYYGLQVDQHAMAQIAQSSAQTGTNPAKMVDALKRVAGRTKTRLYTHYEIDQREIESTIKSYNRLAKKNQKNVFNTPRNGYIPYQPFLAAADAETLKTVRANGTSFKRFSKTIRDKIDDGIPLLWSLQVGVIKERGIPQAGGGHMRLIIGYNDKTGHIIYSDSWGAGHEFKKMTFEEAFTPSINLITIRPSQ